ncbi:alkaline phosphatase family protein [Kriegella aquimaris]|nr:alkaline phosphatase family protein [Kriegella aquimaris]
MIKCIQISLIMLMVQLTGCQDQTKSTDGSSDSHLAKRVIVLGLDGLSVEGFKTAKHPNLDALFEDGTISFTTRSVMPSVTLPNWTSHLTGSGPEEHGVDNNNWTLADHQLPPLEKDSDGYYPSIFKVLKDQMPNIKTAYYYNWGNLINPINQKYLDEVNFLEDDAYEENYSKAKSFALKHKDDPTLIFLYSVHVDHAGHGHEWMSPEYITAIEEADVKIGTLISDLKKDELYEDTHFLLITDHGGKGTGHGGMSPVEMTVPWGIKGPGIKKAKMLDDHNSNKNTALVLARLFGRDSLPKSWTGKVPESIFELK